MWMIKKSQDARPINRSLRIHRRAIAVLNMSRHNTRASVGALGTRGTRERSD